MSHPFSSVDVSEIYQRRLVSPQGASDAILESVVIVDSIHGASGFIYGSVEALTSRPHWVCLAECLARPIVDLRGCDLAGRVFANCHVGSGSELPCSPPFPNLN